jgi:hypothetical protein
MEKDEMEFSKDKSKKDGLTSACRECNNSREKIRRENGGEFSNEQKQKAFLLYGTACQICGSEFNLQVDHKLPQNICNPNKASVSENAWILCKSCNVSKGTKIIREIIKDVSKKTLGPMLLNHIAEKVKNRNFTEVKIRIADKEFTEIRVK